MQLPHLMTPGAANMQFITILVLSFLGLTAAESEQHPVKNVISLVKELDQKVVADGKAEQDTYDKFTHWATKSIESLKKTMEEDKAKSEELKLQVQSKQKESEALGEQISQLEGELAALRASSSTAAEDRAEAKRIYESADADFNTTVDAIDKAIAALEEDPTPAASLLRLPLILETLTEEQEVMLLSLAEERNTFESPLSGSAPEKEAYESKTGPVVDLLRKLKRDFEDKQQKAKLEEIEASSAYDLAKAARDSAKSTATESKGVKEEVKSEADAALVSLSASLESTKGDLAESEKSLQDTEVMVKLKADEFKERVYMRERERKAMAESIRVLEKVAGVRTAAPSGLMQVADSPVNQKEKKLLALEKLRKTARLVQSQDLQLLVERAEADPEDSLAAHAKTVDTAIQQQIFQMKEDQLADDKEKGWCDAEISKTKMDKDFKNTTMEELGDKIAAAKADVVSLVEDIQAAKNVIVNIKQDVHEATLLRQENMNENKLAVEDAQDAQKAIAKAISTLQDYYKEAGAGASSSLQVQPLSGAPDTWEGSYTGDSSGGSTVISLMEEISANFAKMEADTKALEASDDAQFDKKVKDDKAEIARRETEVELKGEEKVRLADKAASLEKSLKLTDRQHASVVSYLEEVMKKCTGETTFEERKAERENRVKELKDARVQVAEAFGVATAAPTAAAGLIAVKAHRPAEQAKMQQDAFLAPVKPVRA